MSKLISDYNKDSLVVALKDLAEMVADSTDEQNQISLEDVLEILYDKAEEEKLDAEQMHQDELDELNDQINY